VPATAASVAQAMPFHSHTEHHLTIHAPSRFSRRSALVLAAALTFAATGYAQAAAPRVKLATSAGDIVVELDAAKAPKSVENFLQYVKDKHYDGTVFHRVIDGFMIQGGGFTADMQQKPTRAPIPLEASNGLKNDKYTIAMARTGNPELGHLAVLHQREEQRLAQRAQPRRLRLHRVRQGRGRHRRGRQDPRRATGNKGGMQNVPLEAVTIKSATLLAK
jgi:peptidyl-prolyl cis-trans isomerase A (cyclophilin A)